MKRLDILKAFEREINKLDDAINKPVTEDSLYWLNQAVNKFIKERFNGNAPHFTSYEQNEKRTKDLIRLYRSAVVAENTDDIPVEWLTDGNQYRVQYYIWPDNVLYILSEDVIITDNNDNHAYDTSVFECTADNFMYRITNSLTDFHYNHHKARPLRVRIGEYNRDSYGDTLMYLEVILLNDKNYKVQRYLISYICRPEVLTDDRPDDIDVEYNDFEDSVWFEIIKIAAQMYIENQSEPRYRTITNEVLTQE